MSLLEAIIHPVRATRRTLGYTSYHDLPEGISFAGRYHETSDITFLADHTWIDAHGTRQLDQQIFDEILKIIAAARKLILLDMFLFNDLLKRDGDKSRPLSAELTEALVEQKQQHPDICIYFITDPCNTVYGGLPNPYQDSIT